MRFWPHPDPHIYWEVAPAWARYCCNPYLSWKRRELEPKHAILHWRDLEGKDIEYILKKDLQFQNWPEGRIRWDACLPIYYCVGARFIRLEKTLVGFKCTAMPLNLQEAREMKAHLRKMARERKRLAKLKKKQARAEKKKQKGKGALKK